MSRSASRGKALSDTVSCLLALRLVANNSLSHNTQRLSTIWKTSSTIRAFDDVWHGFQHKLVNRATAGINALSEITKPPQDRQTHLSTPFDRHDSDHAPTHPDQISKESAHDIEPSTTTSNDDPYLNRMQNLFENPPNTPSSSNDHSSATQTSTHSPQEANPHRAKMKSAPVPSSRVGRFLQYSVFGVGVGTVTEALRRATIGGTSSGSLLLTNTNVQRIVERLSRMRGAALKLGQMLSIQDSSMMPPELEQILLRVQNSANYMPDSQLQMVMRKELGDDWRSNFDEFDLQPIAAASIGQVHKATLKGTGVPVAVKVQYPGVAESIDSDLAYLKSLATLGSFLPRGLYLDNTIRVAKKELAWECDYAREAESMDRFRFLLHRNNGWKGFNVPAVFHELSTKKVLTTEFVEGVSIGSVTHLPQQKLDHIGDMLLQLCLQELFKFRFMQTDPNWSNFLYDERTDTIHLIDFGAAREFSKEFTDAYFHLLRSAAARDKEQSVLWSEKLGFLTGLESETMVNAHISSLMMLAEPFATNLSRFDFRRQDITTKVRSEIPIMLRERLTPPPDESYSLHRKLSGCFLLCTKLGARVATRDLFRKALSEYR
ncbi:hypothetical protein HDU76_000791 [Blyttiomyces sp. JEL0837]|nr:hypothetical protein HDU76_000791 [Blyttiomyces sp. JEL0837]